ncbi:MAG: cupin domain-containing protein [Nitrospirota bacterium]|nr:cupin domain-containing protein [Nitrospirota bacterium]MDH5768741.1 cupin domain-containing protein [Nitrospirota bacterium]
MSTKKKIPISCDWKRTVPQVHKGKKTYTKHKSKLYKHKGNFKWQGIKIEKYKSGGRNWSNILRQTLIGNKKETAKFHVRYFEIEPGGYSSFEMHKHEHVVICVRGKGNALVGEKTYDMNFMDTLYVASHMAHQLRNPFDTPFGFLCIVNAKRDRPKILK